MHFLNPTNVTCTCNIISSQVRKTHQGACILFHHQKESKLLLLRARLQFCQWSTDQCLCLMHETSFLSFCPLRTCLVAYKWFPHCWKKTYMLEAIKTWTVGGNDSNTGAHVRPHSHSLYCGEECTRSCVDVCTSDKCSIRPSLVSRTSTPPVLDCLQCDTLI